MKGFLKKTQSVIVPSAYIRKMATEKYTLVEKKITTISFNGNIKRGQAKKKLQPGIAEKISDGKLFFLAIAEQHFADELVGLLKAFSKIKKMQQTNMRLVISGKPDKNFQEQLNNYKYRADVIIHQPANFDEIKQLCEAAYAVVLPSGFDDAGVYCISALQSGVPVVCIKGTASEQTAGNAALFFEKDDYTGLASCMMKLYKDEEGRKKLIEKGKLVIEKLNAERPEILLWQAIEKAIG
jgi:UDP-N-acetylglucosamine 2-epimerase